MHSSYGESEFLLPEQYVLWGMMERSKSRYIPNIFCLKMHSYFAESIWYLACLHLDPGLLLLDLEHGRYLLCLRDALSGAQHLEEGRADIGPEVISFALQILQSGLQIQFRPLEFAVLPQPGEHLDVPGHGHAAASYGLVLHEVVCGLVKDTARGQAVAAPGGEGGGVAPPGFRQGGLSVLRDKLLALYLDVVFKGIADAVLQGPDPVRSRHLLCRRLV